MATNKLMLGEIVVPLDQYASQGNAILGIRGSGKSYTATYIAERLLDAGVPIVAFDPIGIWRFLRVGGADGVEGYKVVVAGGEHGDIPLTAAGAAEIMRAAMRDGISVVFDLYDIQMSKADWRRVVEAAMKVLLYENKAFGLRHVFLEEAAEFCPQRLPAGDSATSAVYSVVERLARMGGNAQLGYTLINQRAEEVNKAVLELCDLLILHRQKGRNSLIALGKWLDVAQAKGKIAEDVPALGDGEAFVWPAGDTPPTRTRIPTKRTFHPDRKRAKAATALAEQRTIDVSAFVTTMRDSLAALLKEAEGNDPKQLRAEIGRLNRELAKKAPASPAIDYAAIEDARKNGYAIALGTFRPTLERLKTLAAAAGETIEGALADIERMERSPAPRAPSQVARPEHRQAQAAINVVARDRVHTIASGLTGPQQRVLDAIAWWESIGQNGPDKGQVGFIAGYRVGRNVGGTFGNILGQLRSADLIGYPAPGAVTLTAAGSKAARIPSVRPTTEALQDAIRARLDGPEKRVLDVLISAYPAELTKQECGARADYTVGENVGGTFGNILGRLRGLGLIDYPRPGSVVALPVLFIDG